MDTELGLGHRAGLKATKQLLQCGGAEAFSASTGMDIKVRDLPTSAIGAVADLAQRSRDQARGRALSRDEDPEPGIEVRRDESLSKPIPVRTYPPSLTHERMHLVQNRVSGVSEVENAVAGTEVDPGVRAHP